MVTLGGYSNPWVYVNSGGCNGTFSFDFGGYAGKVLKLVLSGSDGDYYDTDSRSGTATLSGLKWMP